MFVRSPTGSIGCNKVKLNFLKPQHSFNKLLKKERRHYERNRVFNLEKTNVENTEEFWQHISNLGPRSLNRPSWEEYREHGEILTESVSKKGWDGFQAPLTPPQCLDPDQMVYFSRRSDSSTQTGKIYCTKIEDR